MPRTSPRKKSPRKLAESKITDSPTKPQTERPNTNKCNNKKNKDKPVLYKNSSQISPKKGKLNISKAKSRTRNKNTKVVTTSIPTLSDKNNSEPPKSPSKSKTNISVTNNQNETKDDETNSTNRQKNNHRSPKKGPPSKNHKKGNSKTIEQSLTEETISESQQNTKKRKLQAKSKKEETSSKKKKVDLRKLDHKQIEIEIDLTKPLVGKKKHSPKKSKANKEKSNVSPIKRKTKQNVEENTDNQENFTRVDNEYIAEGFKDDCELFIQRCQTVSKLNFEKFSSVWKSMGFANIYKGRQTGSEIAELSEEVIHIAKTYMLASDRTFEVNVAGLFLVYALLNLQPYKNFAALRLVPKDVPAILALQTEARKQKRLDILYVLGHVLIVGPCQFHLLERECGIDLPLRKYFDGSIVVNDANTQPIGVLSHNKEALSLINNLTLLDEKYERAKKQLQNQKGPDPSLNFTTSTASELQETVQDLIPSFLRQQKGSRQLLIDLSYEKAREESLKSIKDKAMNNVVSPVKHLSGISDRRNKKSPPTPTSSTSRKSRRNKPVKTTFSAKTLTTNFEFTDKQNPKSILEMSLNELEEISHTHPHYKKRTSNFKFIKLLQKQKYDELLINEQNKPEVDNTPSLDLNQPENVVLESNLSLPMVLDDSETPTQVETIAFSKQNITNDNQVLVSNEIGRGIEVEIIDLYKEPRNSGEIDEKKLKDKDHENVEKAKD